MGIDGAPLLTLSILEYLLSWVAIPIVMIPVTIFLGLTDRYVLFVIAYNWSATVQVGLFFLATMLAEVGLLSGDADTLLRIIIAPLYVLTYLTFIARSALSIPWITAVAIVMLDFILEILILTATSALASTT